MPSARARWGTSAGPPHCPAQSGDNGAGTDLVIESVLSGDPAYAIQGRFEPYSGTRTAKVLEQASTSDDSDVLGGRRRSVDLKRHPHSIASAGSSLRLDVDQLLIDERTVPSAQPACGDAVVAMTRRDRRSVPSVEGSARARGLAGRPARLSISSIAFSAKFAGNPLLGWQAVVMTLRRLVFRGRPAGPRLWEEIRPRHSHPASGPSSVSVEGAARKIVVSLR